MRKLNYRMVTVIMRSIAKMIRVHVYLHGTIALYGKGAYVEHRSRSSLIMGTVTILIGRIIHNR